MMATVTARTRDPPRRRIETAFHSPRTQHITNSERRRLMWKHNEAGMIEASYRRVVRDRDEANHSEQRLLELADEFAALLSVEYRTDIELAGHVSDGMETTTIGKTTLNVDSEKS